MCDKLKAQALLAAEDALSAQAADGSMPSGCNGPYGHTETPLRNTGHWLLLWIRAYQWSGNERYRSAARRALEYMRLPQHRPGGANWLQREQKGKDRCNGLIGAAWTFEALLGAATHLQEPGLASLMLDVWSQHQFDSEQGLWHRLEVDGSTREIDKTFNHQLWWAASLAELSQLGVDDPSSQVERFMDCLSVNFTCQRSGLIRHRIRLQWRDYVLDSGSLADRMHQRCKQLRAGASQPLNSIERDVGYHAFSLHAFAKLKRIYPEHNFWNSKSFQKALDYARSDSFIEALSASNPYGFPYNPVGFEMAFVLLVFVPNSRSEQQRWIKRQFDAVGGKVPGEYGCTTDDPATARARLYEALDCF